MSEWIEANPETFFMWVAVIGFVVLGCIGGAAGWKAGKND